MAVDILKPNTLGARPGDVVHTRSSSLFGWLIRKTIPSWGNHDAILAYDEVRDEWYVAEAVSRFVLTPWTDYVRRLEYNQTSMLLFRVVGMSDQIAWQVNRYAIFTARQLSPKYDTAAIGWLFFNAVFRKNSRRNVQHRWYCTEAVANIHKSVTGDELWNVWGDDLPTPYTTEKRHRQHRLELIRKLIATGHPEYS